MKIRIFTTGVVKMSWKSQFSWKSVWHIGGKKLDLDRAVKMWWKCRENLNFHYGRGENVVKIQIFTTVVKICSENSWWKSVVKMCSVNLWCKYVVKICLCVPMESVRPSVVKICGENVVKRCLKILCGVNCGVNVVKMWWKCSEKMSWKDFFCGENCPKSPEISLKKSCDPLINQSQTWNHYEVSFFMRLCPCPFPIKEHSCCEQLC